MSCGGEQSRESTSLPRQLQREAPLNFDPPPTFSLRQIKTRRLRAFMFTHPSKRRYWSVALCCYDNPAQSLTSHFWTVGDRGQSVRLLLSSAVLSPSSGPVSAEAAHCWLP